jgi:predicted DCC family thiol-disulfide oxidoreductase YuxK
MHAGKAETFMPEFTVLIDGLCPLCSREASMLARLDSENKLRLVDIAAPDFDPSRYGRSLEDLMGSIHGVNPDGSIVTGVEVFRKAYAVVGLGWLLAPTRWPVLRQVADAFYRLFARIRPRLRPRRAYGCDSGRCSTT